MFTASIKLSNRSAITCENDGQHPEHKGEQTWSG